MLLIHCPFIKRPFNFYVNTPKKKKNIRLRFCGCIYVFLGIEENKIINFILNEFEVR